MKVCIVCSLSCRKEAELAKDVLEKLDCEVTTPFDDQSGTLFDIQGRYLKSVDSSDVVLAIPKTTGTDLVDDGCSWYGIVGESTSYEISYAVHTNKPVIFGMLPFVKGDWK